jgi:DNA-binding phage protein
MVHVLNAPEACGFVPVDYLGKMLESGMVESSTAAAAVAAAAATTTPRNYSYGSAEAPTTSTALSRTLSTSAAPQFSSTASVHHHLGAAEEFSQLFASHEAWFKAATAKRQEVYASLRAEAADVLKALRESEAKSSAVLSRIHEIGNLVAQERGRNNSSRG